MANRKFYLGQIIFINSKLASRGHEYEKKNEFLENAIKI